MLRRYSTQHPPYVSDFFAKRKFAAHYDRIAGYFSSSVFGLSKEVLEHQKIRIVCNTDVDIDDLHIANIFSHQEKIKNEWISQRDRLFDLINKNENFKALYEGLKSGRIQIRLMAKKHYGFIHGKAGILTFPDGSQTSFVGSVNETYAGWGHNYEILWEDNSKESIEWTQREFDFLWNSPHAIDLPDFVIEDIGKIQKREFSSVEKWKKGLDALKDGGIEDISLSAAFLNTPIYQEDNGFWAHQKDFIELAFSRHLTIGARMVLADMVGLGKTLQLGAMAKLVALTSDKPILIIVPKNLMEQWREELRENLSVPVSMWCSGGWEDNEGNRADLPIDQCPTRIALVSSGIITNSPENKRKLEAVEYDLVIVDEAHKARRKEFAKISGKPLKFNQDDNRLLDFIYQVSPRTRSILLATATPVQIDPIEAWDLLWVMAHGNDMVLGSDRSLWRNNPKWMIEGFKKGFLNEYDTEKLALLADPFLPHEEAVRSFSFENARKQLNMQPTDFRADLNALSPTRRSQLEEKISSRKFMKEYNPFTFSIIRRRRSTLEKEGKLKKITVNLCDDEPLELDPRFKKAFQIAEEFCGELSRRTNKSSGFIKTMILRRVCSSAVAGYNTVRKMLDWKDEHEELMESLAEEEFVADETSEIKAFKNLTAKEMDLLIDLEKELYASLGSDPKWARIKSFLIDRNWREKGCVLFSQYYDTAYWVFKRLQEAFPDEMIGLYAGSGKSKIYRDGEETSVDKNELKRLVATGDIRLLPGTDAASEGLNLQSLSSLINLDLPYNPTRLEQRQGRIRRPGQKEPSVNVVNLMYADSVDERVHQLLSERFENIYELFNEFPEYITMIWAETAVGNNNEAKENIRQIQDAKRKEPFELQERPVQDYSKWERNHICIEEEEAERLLKNKWYWLCTE